MDRGLTHIALPVTDVDRSIAFYARFAAMQVVHRRQASDGHSDVVWISDLSRPFVIVLVESPGGDPPLGPFAHLGVAVASREELERLCGLARADGCLIRGPEDSGPPVGMWAFLHDPDGHAVELSYGQNVEWAVEEARKATGIRD